MAFLVKPIKQADLEPAIANWWSDDHGLAVVEPDVLYVRGSIMATLDRRIVGNDTDAVEVKSTAKYVSRPERYWWWQCQAQCYAADLERVHLAVLDASMSLSNYVVERDDEAIATSSRPSAASPTAPPGSTTRRSSSKA